VERPPEAAPSGPAAAPAARGRRSSGAAILLFGAACALAGATLLTFAPDDSNAVMLATLASQALFACTAIGGARLAGRALLPRGLRLERPALGVAALALLAVGFVCVSHALSVVLSLLGLRSSGTLGEIDRVMASVSGASRLLAVLAVGLAPAIGEELLFRGLVQQIALRPLGAVGAIFVSALAFGAIHLDPVHSPTAFVLGLYLGAVVELGGGLWGAVFCHALNNVLAVIGPAVAVDTLPGGAVTASAGLFGAGAALLGLVAARRLRSGDPRGTATDPGVG
jgi:membrane protease YdiL (CAAX protease family)